MSTERAAPPQTSGLAIASLVLGIIGIPLAMFFVFGIVGLVLGIVALTQISSRKGALGGKGIAIAGVILSGIGSCFVFIAIVAAIAIPNLLSSRVAANEAATVAALRTYLGAQNQFYRMDPYGKGLRVYANPEDGKGFPDLYEIGGPGSGGSALRMIDLSFAEASSPARPKAGYYFVDLTYGDYSIDCGLCAVPARYPSTGRNTFVMDVSGTVYMKDTQGEPVTTYPDVAGGGWIPVGY